MSTGRAGARDGRDHALVTALERARIMTANLLESIRLLLGRGVVRSCGGGGGGGVGGGQGS